MGIIDDMLYTLNQLVQELSSCSSAETCVPIQKDFTKIVEKAMEVFKQGGITVEVKALPLPMYFWATEELPELIKDNSNIRKIRNQLILFKNSINHILNPKEE